MGWTGAFVGLGQAILSNIQSDITLTAHFDLAESLSNMPVHFTPVTLTNTSCTIVGTVDINQINAINGEDEVWGYFLKIKMAMIILWGHV